MPLFKFSYVDTSVVIATVVSENAFLDAQLESSVIGLESEIVADLAYIEALGLVAGVVVSEIPYVIVRLKQQDVADIIANNVFIDAIASVSVSGVADVYSEIPFVSVSGASENTIGSVVPFLFGFASASVSGVANCSCIIPDVDSVCVGVVGLGANVSASIPFISALSSTELVGTASTVVAEIPFTSALLKTVSSAGYDYGTETDAVLRHSYTRRCI